MDADTEALPAGETGQAPAGTPPTLPRIADYWPDQATAPARPFRQPPALTPLPPPKPPRHWAKPIIGTAVALLLLAGAAVTGRHFITRPTAARPGSTVAPPPAAATNPAAGPATVLPEPSATTSNRAPAPLPPTSAAAPTTTTTTTTTTPPPPPPPPAALPAAGSFELASDIAEITIGTARLDSGIARVDSGGGRAVPKLRLAGATAKLTVDTKGDKETKVAVILDERVAWTVRISAGTRTTRINLSGGAVNRIDLIGGTHDIDLTLPRLRSAVPIRMTGGVNTWRITTADRVPVRLIARDGAGDVKLYGDDRGGIAKGVRVNTTAGSNGRLDLDAVGGIGSLTVDER